jgi:predicted aldo/keto reductase-like oxidoreductase
VEYIDLYQIHALRVDEIDRALGPGGALEALRQAKARGKIRFIGVSTHWPEAARRLIACGEFDTIQVPYNPVDMEGFGRIIPEANAAGLGILVMKALAGGVLTKVETALKFALAKDVSVVLLGIATGEQLAADVRTARSGTVVVPGEMKALIEEARGLGRHFCRQCGYCLQDCPQQIQIPTVLSLLRYFQSYASQDWAIAEYRTLAVKAKTCEECGRCEQICPYDLPIREMLKTAHSKLNPYGGVALTRKAYLSGRSLLHALRLNRLLRPYKKRIVRFLRIFVPRAR